MKYDSKFDWWLAAMIAASLVFLVVGGNYWVGAPVVAILMLCAYPQTYETTPAGLAVKTAFGRTLIPYRVMTFVGPTASRVRIRYGLASEMIVTPAHCDQFLADLAERTPHLSRQGQSLSLTYA